MSIIDEWIAGFKEKLLVADYELLVKKLLSRWQLATSN
jgi:hypothetical protein